MKSNSQKVTLVVLGLVVGLVIGLAMPQIIQKQQDFSRFAEARNAAPDKAEFDRNFEAMAKWFEDYKKDNPGATDEDARKAFDKIWENAK